MKNCTCTIREEAFSTYHTYIDHETGSRLCDSCDGFVTGPDDQFSDLNKVDYNNEPDGEDEAADQYNYERQNGDFETF